MAEIGELVDFGLIDEDEEPCPFDHDLPEPPKIDNELVGDGDKLGQNLAKKDFSDVFGIVVSYRF